METVKRRKGEKEERRRVREREGKEGRKAEREERQERGGSLTISPLIKVPKYCSLDSYLIAKKTVLFFLDY